ncbi:MAG TPA: lysophospholipid acyltransferase family protein [Candidatus Acidoferrum sp.]|nr:lysophospholipid acyltransferase family protein [Candidatus Acidoferrum sp.]
MKTAWLAVRSALLWTVSWIHFFIGVATLIPCGMIAGPRKIDLFVRIFNRNVVRLAGARLTAKFAPGFDPKQTCFFSVNHTNLFDPFVLYSVIPQYVRGLELESHFRIPLYGMLMKRFGNVPVPDVRRPAELRRMLLQTKKALDGGTSLIVFPEGTRTPDGRIHEFEDGGFRMAVQFGCPIVPVSIVGSFEFNRKDHWWLHPSHIVVHIHDTIDTKGLKKDDVPALRDRVRAIMSAPVDAHYKVLDASQNN